MIGIIDNMYCRHFNVSLLNPNLARFPACGSFLLAMQCHTDGNLPTRAKKTGIANIAACGHCAELGFAGSLMRMKLIGSAGIADRAVIGCTQTTRGGSIGV